jgi:hypothetical protein
LATTVKYALTSPSIEGRAKGGRAGELTGQLFGGQIQLSDLQITRQRVKSVRGDVIAKNLDLGALAEMSPAVALSERRLEGRFTGKISGGQVDQRGPAEGPESLHIARTAIFSILVVSDGNFVVL